MDEKIKAFAALLEAETRAKYEKFFTCPNREDREQLVQQSSVVTVIPGKKYTKVDVGRSGKYMVDADGNIFGVKGYGVIHRGHHYGTLDTINEWYWGDYTAVRKTA